MRILHVISSLAATGKAWQLCRLAHGLDRSNFSQLVCVLADTGPLQPQLESAQIAIRNLVRHRRFDAYVWRKLRAEIREFQPDLIHVWDSGAHVITGVSTTGLARRSPIIRQGLDWDSSNVLELLYQKHWLLPQAARVVLSGSPMPEVAQWATESEIHTTTIPLGIDSTASNPPSRAEFLREFNIAEDLPCLAVVGRLLTRKRIKDLIWVVDMLRFYGLKLRLLVFGNGPQEWRLRRFARQCQVTDYVHFLGERAELTQWLPHCALLLQADSVSGDGTAILEAMACGIPVVASDLPRHRDLITPGENGYLIPVGARADFANTANLLLKEPELARRLGEVGRERVRRDFTSATMVEKFSTLYREVLRP